MNPLRRRLPAALAAAAATVLLLLVWAPGLRDTLPLPPFLVSGSGTRADSDAAALIVEDRYVDVAAASSAAASAASACDAASSANATATPSEPVNWQAALSKRDDATATRDDATTTRDDTTATRDDATATSDCRDRGTRPFRFHVYTLPDTCWKVHLDTAESGNAGYASTTTDPGNFWTEVFIFKYLT